MSKTSTSCADGINILYLAQQSLSHPKANLYYALHKHFPCYVCSDDTLPRNSFIPFTDLNQRFKSAAIGGLTTYIHTPQKMGGHSSKKDILTDGREYINNPPSP